MKSCRNCDHAYLRTEKTAAWNYEACALGCAPMMPYLDGLCDLYTPMKAEKKAVFLNVHPRLIFLDAIDLQERQ